MLRGNTHRKRVSEVAKKNVNDLFTAKSSCTNPFYLPFVCDTDTNLPISFGCHKAPLWLVDRHRRGKAIRTAAREMKCVTDRLYGVEVCQDPVSIVMQQPIGDYSVLGALASKNSLYAG